MKLLLFFYNFSLKLLEDGVIEPSQLCTTLVKEAVWKGAKVLEQCNVQQILYNNDGSKVIGVNTSQGIIHTNKIINTRGIKCFTVQSIVFFINFFSLDKGFGRNKI